MSIFTPHRMSEETAGAGFQPVKLVLIVLVILMLIFYASRWYVAQVSLPRYCDETELVLQRLAAINTASRPAGDGSRVKYVVAAKLEFLLPSRSNEKVEDYLLRLKTRLEEQCL